MMKILAAASALTLMTGLAVAGDFYGGFASPDLGPTVSNDQLPVAPASAPGGPRISLADFLQGNPDAPQYAYGSGDLGGTRSPSLSRPISYDDFVRGNPDIDVGTGFLVESNPPSGGTHQGIATHMTRPQSGR